MEMMVRMKNTGTAAQKAQNALCFHYGICYDADGKANPKSNAPSKPSKKSDKEELIAKINNSIVYPSPANSYTTVKYNLLHADEATQLNIFDNLGRRVYSTELGEGYQGEKLIDTRDFTNGVYIVEIRQDGAQIEVNKFVVTH